MRDTVEIMETMEAYETVKVAKTRVDILLIRVKVFRRSDFGTSKMVLGKIKGSEVI